MPTREAVFNALFAAVSQATDFKTKSRRITFDPDQGPTQTVATPDPQPALYVLEDGEQTIQGNHGSPPKRLWRALLLIWCKIPGGYTPGVPDGSAPGATEINNLLDAIELTFAPDDPMRGTFTLGHLVERCWIEGQTVKVPGDYNPSGQCFAAVPVSILVP